MRIDCKRRVSSSLGAPFSVKTECQATIPREIRIFHQGGRRREDRRGIAKNENSGPGSIWYRCSPLYIIRTSLTGLLRAATYASGKRETERSLAKRMCRPGHARGKKLKSSPPS